MSNDIYRIYRCPSPTGRGFKDWAFRANADGSVDVRWGKADRLVQHCHYPRGSKQTINIWPTEAEKERKGYVYQGTGGIDSSGRFTLTSAQAAPQVPPTPAAPKKAATRKAKLANINWDDLETDVPSVYF